MTIRKVKRIIILKGEGKHQKTRKENSMYTVCFFDESTMDEAVLFSGSLAECLSYVGGDAEMYIVEPDGFTVYAA